LASDIQSNFKPVLSMKIKPVPRQKKVTVELKPSDERLLEKGAASARAGSPFRLNKILVPVDFSDFSTKALDYALAFADQFDAQIILLHVVEPAVYPESSMLVATALDDLNNDLTKVAQQKLNELKRERIGDRVSSELLVRLGRAFSEIVAAASELDVDLIILATHGYTGLKHVLLGSTAERVVRHAPCPVLTVRDPEHEFLRSPGATRTS
jgi:nucleotide-binding universal stress UspA family protein